MDIKVGRGAWFKTVEEAETVAKYLVQTGKLIGMNMTATLTDMNSPLGRCVGNSLEVWDALETLRGRGRKDLVQLVAVQVSVGRRERKYLVHQADIPYDCCSSKSYVVSLTY